MLAICLVAAASWLYYKAIYQETTERVFTKLGGLYHSYKIAKTEQTCVIDDWGYHVGEIKLQQEREMQNASNTISHTYSPSDSCSEFVSTLTASTLLGVLTGGLIPLIGPD